MAKQLTFNYQGKDYVLEFTRNSIRQMEQQGFVANDIEDKPMTVLPALFAGAFIAHHRFIKAELVDEIFSKLDDKYALLERLGEMYADPIQSLMDSPTEGNVNWTPNW